MATRISKILVELGLDPRDFEKNLKKASRRLKRTGAELTSTGRGLTAGVTVPLVAAGGLALKAAVDFETSMADVAKTVKGTDEQIAALGGELLDMSKRLPVTVSGLASVAEEAGRLGIERKNILAFTETIVRLGETSTLSLEEAAVGLARFTNITGGAQKDIGNVANSLTVLGSEFAANESQILEFSLRLAGAGDTIGLTAAEILGIGTALAAVGLNAESGGSAFSRVMIDIAKAVEKGGDRLEKFAEVAGQSTTEFARAFKKDAAGALESFILGLGNLRDTSAPIFSILEGMGLDTLRVRDALLRASKATDLFSGAVARSTEVSSRNTETIELSNKKFETSRAQLQLFQNQVVAVAIGLGNLMIPQMRQVLETVETWVKSFGSLDDETKRLIINIGLWTAAIGPAVLVMGIFIRTIRAAIQVTLALKTALVVLARNPLTTLVVVLGSVVAAEVLFSGKTVEATENTKKFADQLDRVNRVARSQLVVTFKDLEKRLQFINEVFESSKGILSENERQTVRLTARVSAYDSAIASLATALESEKEALPLLINLREKARETLEGLTTATLGGTIMNDLFAASQGFVNEKLFQMIEFMTGLRTLLEEQPEQVRTAAEAWDQWRESIDVTGARLVDTFTGFIDQSVSSFASGMGQMAIGAKTLGEFMDGLWKSILSSGVAMFTRLAIEWALSSVSAIAAGTVQHASRLGQLASQTFGGAFAATAAIPVIGPLLAPGVAAASLAAMLSGAATAFGTGTALGAVQLGEGGIVTGPTLALIGEAGEDEAVLSLSRLREFVAPRSMTVNMFVDRQLLATKNVEGMSDVLDMYLGDRF